MKVIASHPSKTSEFSSVVLCGFYFVCLFGMMGITKALVDRELLGNENLRYMALLNFVLGLLPVFANYKTYKSNFAKIGNRRLGQQQLDKKN